MGNSQRHQSYPRSYGDAFCLSFEHHAFTLKVPEGWTTEFRTGLRTFFWLLVPRLYVAMGPSPRPRHSNFLLSSSSGEIELIDLMWMLIVL